MSERAEWLIRCDKSGLWWRDKAMGYTANLLEAGLFTEREAKSWHTPADVHPLERHDSAVHISVYEDLIRQSATRLLRLVDPSFFEAERVIQQVVLDDMMFDRYTSRERQHLIDAIRFRLSRGDYDAPRARKVPCCERDHDHDGNCDRHPNGVFTPIVVTRHFDQAIQTVVERQWTPHQFTAETRFLAEDAVCAICGVTESRHP